MGLPRREGRKAEEAPRARLPGAVWAWSWRPRSPAKVTK